jgi:membrane protease YdiL (CAAX protease family)
MQASTRPRAASSTSPRPILVAVALLVLFELVANGATLLLDAATALDGKVRDLVAETLLAGLVVGLVAALGWWRSTGFSTPFARWRHPRLLVLPLALTLLPFTGGFKGVDGGTLGVLVVGYALNSVAEDGMFRGIVPRVLRDRGLITAIVISSLLFGLAHFGNIVSRPDQSVPITAAQAFGAFTEAIGITAVRLATDTLWPVMLVHFLADLFGQLGGAPIVLWHVVYSVILLVYGIWVYRRHRTDMERSLLAEDEARALA